MSETSSSDYSASTPVISELFGVNSEPQTTASGKCGAMTMWTLDEKGTLHITGEGKMFDYYDEPFYGGKDIGKSIKKAVIDEGITYIGSYAFKDLENLKTVTIPNSVGSIGIRAFEGCISLGKVDLPKSVILYDGAFADCDSLRSVTIPEGLSYVGNNFELDETIWDFAFVGCDRLERFEVSSDNIQYDSLDGVLVNKDHTRIIAYPAGRKGHYTIPEGITDVDEEAFYRCSGLDSLTIGKNVSHASFYSFSGCTGLDSFDVSEDNSIFRVVDGVLMNKDLSEICAYPAGRKGPYTIPSSVKSIDFGAFAYCEGLESVIIPSSVEEINDSAFKGCTGLTSLVIPESVHNIYSEAFSDCVNLVSALVPYCIFSSNDYYSSDIFKNCGFRTAGPEGSGCDLEYRTSEDGEYISYGAFGGMSKLTSVIIPGSVKSIDDYAFWNCVSMTDIAIPAGVEDISSYAFNGCGSLTHIDVAEDNGQYSSVDGILMDKSGGTVVAFPPGRTGSYTVQPPVEFIENGAFNNCSLSSLTIYDFGNFGLEGDMFRGCRFKTAGPIGSGCDLEFDWSGEIPKEAFSGLPYLRTVTFPDSLVSIGEYAFYNCPRLEEVVFPQSLRSIGDGTFLDCPSLKNLSFPSGLNEIGEWAFARCDSLTEVVLPSGLIEVKDRLFSDCTHLRKAVISEGVEKMDYGVFEDCANLEEIMLPESLKSIGSSVISGCDKLTEINIGGGVSEIDSWAFHDIGSLNNINVSADNTTYASLDGILMSKDLHTLVAYPVGRDGDVTVGENVNIIGKSAFRTAKKISSVTIPDTVTEIGANAFAECSGLKAVSLPSTIEIIDSGTFRECSSLTDVVIPDSIREIGKNAFDECKALRSVTFGKNVETIGEDAFSGCGSLTSVTIPRGVISLDPFPFVGCYSLTSINVERDNTIFTSEDGVLMTKDRKHLLMFPKARKGAYTVPDGVEEIETEAFRYCTDLTSVTLPDSLRDIGEEAFYCCDGLRTIEIPDGTETIGVRAFGSCCNLETVYVAGSVKNIGREAFSGCDKLTEVRLGSRETAIADDAFEYCENFKSVIYPDISEGAPEVQRMGGTDRYETSNIICSAGWENSDTVIIASGASYPDALAGAVLAKYYDAPIILTEKDSIRANTLDQIRSLQTKNAIILGGTAAVSDNVENILRSSGYAVSRISGANRNATAAEIAYQLGGKKDTVFCKLRTESTVCTEF